MRPVHFAAGAFMAAPDVAAVNTASRSCAQTVTKSPSTGRNPTGGTAEQRAARATQSRCSARGIAFQDRAGRSKRVSASGQFP